MTRMDKIETALVFLPKEVRNSFSDILFYSKAHPPERHEKELLGSPMAVNIVSGDLIIVSDHDFFLGCEVSNMLHIIIHEEGHLKLTPLTIGIAMENFERVNAITNNESITEFILEFVYNFDVNQYNAIKYKKYDELMTKLDWFLSLKVKGKLDRILVQSQYVDKKQIQNKKSKEIRNYLDRTNNLTYERAIKIYEFLKDELEKEKPSCVLVCPFASQCNGKCLLEQSNDKNKQDGITMTCPQNKQGQDDQDKDNQDDQDGQGNDQQDNDQQQDGQNGKEKPQDCDENDDKKDDGKDGDAGDKKDKDKSDDGKDKQSDSGNKEPKPYEFKNNLKNKMEVLGNHGKLEDQKVEEFEIEENTVTKELTHGEKEELRKKMARDHKDGGTQSGTFNHGSVPPRIIKASNAIKVLEKIKNSIAGVNIPKKWMRGHGEPYDVSNMVDFSEISDVLSMSDITLLEETNGNFEPMVLIRHYEEGKRNVVIARDRSDSMTYDNGVRNEFAQSGSIGIIELLKKKGVKIAYAEFNTATKIYMYDKKPWTKKYGEVMMHAVSCINNGGTDIDKLLNDLMGTLGRDFDVLLISDGESNVGDVTISNLVKKEIRVFPIFIGGSGYSLLERVAKETGGDLFLVTKTSEGMITIVDAVVKATS